MHNGIELSFGNVLIMMLGLGVGFWMARAPKSVLMLTSNRYRGIGLDGDRPVVAAIVRNFGRFMFFSLLSSMLLVFAPESLAKWPYYSLVALISAIGISVLVLRKSNKKDLYAALQAPPANGSTPRRS